MCMCMYMYVYVYVYVYTYIYIYIYIISIYLTSPSCAAMEARASLGCVGRRAAASGAPSGARDEGGFARGWWNTAGNLIEFVWLKEVYHQPHVIGMCMKHRGVQFHRIQDFKQLLFQQYSANVSLRQLPDGVGTNGVVREVPRFPPVNFHAGNNVAACADLQHNMSKCMEFVALLGPSVETRLSRPRIVWKPVKAGCPQPTPTSTLNKSGGRSHRIALCHSGKSGERSRRMGLANCGSASVLLETFLMGPPALGGGSVTWMRIDLRDLFLRSIRLSAANVTCAESG